MITPDRQSTDAIDVTSIDDLKALIGFDTLESDANQAISTDAADLVAFGRPFISNPDLVHRLRENAPLNPLQEDKLYGGGAEGYTDYPTLNASG